MNMTEITQPIPARLRNVAVNGHVAGAEDIIDDALQKDQATINQEVQEVIGTGGSIDSRIASAVATETTRAQAAEADRYTKSETYTKTEVNGLVDTPHQEYVTVDAYANLPATGSKDTIYRVSNYNGSTSQVDASVYSEYAWDGSQYVFLCVKSQIGEVFDISVYNNNAKYADLAAALNGGANIPQSLQKGGMSVKFVQSNDNKYVQYRLMNQSFSTTEADWQKQGAEVSVIQNTQTGGYDLNIGSDKTNIASQEELMGLPAASSASGSIGGNGKIQNIGTSGYEHYYLKVNPGDVMNLKANISTTCDYIVLKTYIPGASAQEFCDSIQGRQRIAENTNVSITIPPDAHYVAVTKTYNNYDYSPSVWVVNGVDAIKGQGSIFERLDSIEQIIGSGSHLEYDSTNKMFSFYSSLAERTVVFYISFVSSNADVQKLWRLTHGDVFESNGVKIGRCIQAGENEFAAQFKGFSSIGGYTGGYHGGELVDGDENCFIDFFADGVKITSDMMANDFSIRCNSFKYIQYTTLNKVKDSAEQPIPSYPIFAHHYKETTMNDGGYTCKNIVVFNSNVDIVQYYSGLVCVGKTIGKNCILPTGVVGECVGDNSSFVATTPTIDKIIYFHETNKLLAEVSSEFVQSALEGRGQLVESVWDRPNDSKYYRYIIDNTGISVTNGDLIETETKVKFK